MTTSEQPLSDDELDAVLSHAHDELVQHAHRHIHSDAARVQHYSTNVDGGRPLVFLCFAAADHETANRLGQDLRSRGVAITSYGYSIGPGENIVLAVDSVLTQSDYFLLLWSQASMDQPWINEQWTAAFARGLREQRRLLFVVRLDRTPLPMMLAPRPCLDAFDGWDRTVDELVATWKHDRALGHPVLPAPSPAERRADPGTSVVLYVRNQALNVSHVLVTPARSTGQDLRNQIRAELELKDQISHFDDSIGLRFSYRFMNGDEPLGDKPLAELGLADGGLVDLQVEVETFSPDGESTSMAYLGDGEPPGLSLGLKRSLISSAFGHLRP
jgi:hypothetical protein